MAGDIAAQKAWLNRHLRDRYGLDPARDDEAIAALATTAYVVSCWRNTVLEDVHCGGYVPTARRGSYAREGIPDIDLARLNVATWRQIRPHVTSTGIDVIAVRDLLRNKDRAVRIGDDNHTIGELFNGVWTKLSWHLNEGAWLPAQVAYLLGEDDAAAVRYFAACGGSYASEWFGNPWWDAAIQAGASEEPPAHPHHLDLARRAPNELDEPGIRWVMKANHSESFRGAVARWRHEHGADSTAPGELLFPPGVPELPAHMRTRP